MTETENATLMGSRDPKFPGEESVPHRHKLLGGGGLAPVKSSSAPLEGRTMRGWGAPSVELSPLSLLKLGAGASRLLGQLPTGTRVYLPALPADPPGVIDDALSLLCRETAGRLVPVPHVAAQRTGSVDDLERRLCNWQKNSADGVAEVLVVRGDAHAHHGTGAEAAVRGTGGAFSTTMELLQSGALQRCGVRVVGLCGHPEGVGGVCMEEALRGLLPKLSWASEAGLQASVVTQFCFDASATAAYVEALHGMDSSADVRLGVVSQSSRSLRQRMATRCGVAPPPPLLDSAPDCWPGGYLRELARWNAGHRADGTLALHVYPFGGPLPALEWWREAAGDPTLEGMLTPLV